RQQVDRERQSVAGMHEPKAYEAYVLGGETEVDERGQDGHECRLQRHGQKADQGEKEHVAAPELHPGERVGGERRDRHRDDRGRGCDPLARDRHRLASTALNCRRLKMSTGITAATRMIATALASPKSCEAVSSLYIRLARTSVS